MDVLQIELAKLRRDANLSQSISDVDLIIEQLERARETIVESMSFSSNTLLHLVARGCETPLCAF
jgi:hypothetical protein